MPSKQLLVTKDSLLGEIKTYITDENDLKLIEKAIDFEIKRQSRLLLLGQEIQQETRRFDESKKETVLMRVKTDAVDYKYFTEPNIPPIKIDDEFIKDAIDTCPELYDSKLNRYLNDYKINDVDAKILLNSVEFADYFDKVASFSNSYQNIANFLISIVQRYLNKENISIKDFKVEPKYIAELVELLKSKQINSTQGNEIFNELCASNRSPKEIQKEKGFILMNDDSKIREIVKEIIASDPSIAENFKAGKTRSQGFVMGQLMKKTGGKVDPAKANKIIVEELLK